MMAVQKTETTRMDLKVDEDFIQQHQRMIYSLCYRMTGSVPDAEDLTQETFITAHREMDTFRGNSKVSSWLYRIGLNRCLNWQKRRDRQQKLHEQWVVRRELNAKETDNDGRVQEALMRLSVEERSAVILVIFDGLKHGEAAAALGCAETTVSWRLFQARRRLKALLSKS